METFIANVALWIAPAFLAWFLIPGHLLNRVGYASARWAETIAWATFIGASATLAMFFLTGREAVFVEIGPDALWGVRLDALSTPLLTLVTFLAAIVLRFSRNYLGGGPRQGTFAKWICVTTGSVLAFIVAPGLVQFALAWIATSLSLHQLLVFFPKQRGTLFSARKKFLVSRIADLAIIAAFIGIYRTCGTQDFELIFTQMASGSESLNLVGWLIAIAAILKSAQFPFHTWLPDTMGTPTPVSALMHAGIINAGGVLLIRFSPLFVQSTTPLYLVATLGAITAIFGSFVMLSQTSVKRSLAYSTIAQMGFMLMQCGLGAFHLALLHIIAHSLYKAHTFLSSGTSVNVIDSLATNSMPTSKTYFPLFSAIGISFALVSGLFYLKGSSFHEKPGMLALGVVVAMSIAQLLHRQLRREVTFTALAKVIVAASGVAIAYLILSIFAAWWMNPLTQSLPLVHSEFEWFIALMLFLSLTTTLQLQSGSSFLIPGRLHDALYVHALNGFYANAIANRLLKLIKLEPKNT